MKGLMMVLALVIATPAFAHGQNTLALSGTVVATCLTSPACPDGDIWAVTGSVRPTIKIIDNQIRVSTHDNATALDTCTGVSYTNVNNLGRNRQNFNFIPGIPATFYMHLDAIVENGGRQFAIGSFLIINIDANQAITLATEVSSVFCE